MARDTSRGARRQVRREQRRGRRQLRRRLLRYLAIFGIGLLGLAVIVGLIIPSLPGRQASPLDRSSGPGTHPADLGNRHFAPGETAPAGYYNSVPPTSGAHAPAPERCGIFQSPVPDEVQVHNLEHGFVLVQYSTQDQALISQLTKAVQQLPGWPGYLILAPYPKMDKPIALTAWRAVQHLDTADEGAIRAFSDAYRGRGPEAGAPSC